MNNHFQGSNCVNRPANTGPNPPPIGAAAPKKAILKFRIFPGGKVVAMMPIAFGRIRPAPIPVNPRAILNETVSPQKAFISDHPVHHTPPNKRIYLWPYIAPSRPLTRTKVPCVNLTQYPSNAQCAIWPVESSRVRGCEPACLCWSVDP